jgi:hypothetical protein
LIILLLLVVAVALADMRRVEAALVVLEQVQVFP